MMATWMSRMPDSWWKSMEKYYADQPQQLSYLLQMRDGIRNTEERQLINQLMGVRLDNTKGCSSKTEE